MASSRSLWAWGIGLAVLGVSGGIAVGLESDGDVTTADAHTALSCEDSGVSVSQWDYELVDGRINALTVSNISDTCIGAEMAASVADGDGAVIAATEGRELTGPEVRLAFQELRPSVADVEQLDVYIVGAGDPPDDPVPPMSVTWDGAGPSAVACEGPVTWTFVLTGDLRGVKAEVTATYETAGQIGPVPAERTGGGPLNELVATVTTAGGDVLEQAWATLTKEPDDSMSLTLADAVCSDG